jgi:hypothetical protein
MRKLFLTGLALAMAASAYAAPNVANATQKGSLLIFPDIQVDDDENTIIRLQNDGSLAVDVKCYWMDGEKNRLDFIITLTKNQAIWFEARGGEGEPYQVNAFPEEDNNGLNWAVGVGNPLLDGEDKGLLVCFAVDEGAMNQVKWNHLSGTATVIEEVEEDDDEDFSSYEYNAYAFYVPPSVFAPFDQAPVGDAGTLLLDGVRYDACPLYQIGQLSPESEEDEELEIEGFEIDIEENSLAVAGCDLDLTQDWEAQWTKLAFDVWNHQEVKFTGAFECADSWHEVEFEDIDSGSQNFNADNVGSTALRYRVQGVKSSQCDEILDPVEGTAEQRGILAVQSTLMEIEEEGEEDATLSLVGTTLASAGKFNGTIKYDPAGVVPEGR